MRIVYRPRRSTYFRTLGGRRFLIEVNEDAGEVLRAYADGSRELAGHTVEGIRRIARSAKWRRAE